MAVKIRLSRIGTTNRPFYRVVATDARNKRDGEILANVGTYDPVNGMVVQFHENIYQDWLSKGAMVTDSVKKIYRLYKKTAKLQDVSIVAPEKAAKVEKTAEEA